MVYTSENSLLVGHARGLVEAQGIEVTLRNQFASGVTGEVPVFETWPELWVVNDRDYDRACAIIASAFSDSDGDPWKCSHCHEENDASFEFCWKCGTGMQGMAGE